MKHRVCAQGTRESMLPLTPRLIIKFAHASKKPNATMLEIIAIIIMANALTNVPLKYCRAPQPMIIIKINIVIAKLTINNVSGFQDSWFDPRTACY
jgi:vesicle coat complex subunit